VNLPDQPITSWLISSVGGRGEVDDVPPTYEGGAKKRVTAGESGTSRAEAMLGFVIVMAGISLLVAGAVAAFVSSNSSASAALVAVGASSLLAMLFRDRIQEAKLGSFEIKLAIQMKDQLRSAFDLKVRGNYESSERELNHAFARFVGDLDGQEYRTYYESQNYELEVYEKLGRIVHERFGGQIQNSSARHSFYPLVDAVLQLDGARVRKALEERDSELCPELIEHFSQNEHLRVGVTIRPGPELEADTLVNRLHDNVQNGALNATCFLLIQNCRDRETGRTFRSLARREGMHAASAVWPAEGTVERLDTAITEAILAICTEPLHLGNGT
jgi:hypothetical protein